MQDLTNAYNRQCKYPILSEVQMVYNSVPHMWVGLLAKVDEDEVDIFDELDEVDDWEEDDDWEEM